MQKRGAYLRDSRRKIIKMGIPKLTSFLEKNFTGWTSKNVTGCLVIDGFSLCYYLYSFDWSHGGQYPQFHNCVVKFFEALRLSKIEPIVVFDGIDYKQEKVMTTMKRRKEMIRTINEHVVHSRLRRLDAVNNILPLLTKEEFQYTLSSLLVKQVVVDGEADFIIAQLANYYSCPVLSKDSDFYMHTLKGGFIPMDRFHWNSTPIVAEVYHISRFMDQFEFRHESVRLIIPAISGNDFLPPISSRRFVDKMVSSKCHPLSSIICYARQFSNLDDFITKITSLDNLSASEKDTLRNNCLNCRQMYSCCEVRSLEDVVSATELLAYDGCHIPRWILDRFRSCNLRHSVMEAIVLHKCVLRVATDNFHQPSSLMSSRPLREALYCILNINIMTEHIRCGLDIVGEKINITDRKNLPSLKQIPTLQQSERSRVLYFILCCDVEAIEKLDNKWRLVTASVIFWILHAKVPRHVAKALLLCFVCCFHHTHGDTLRQFRSSEIPQHFLQSPQWLDVLHWFAQWQSVYLDAISINQILCCPVEYCSPANLYDGKISIYFASLHHGTTSIETKLSGPQQKLYQLLLDVVLSHGVLASHSAKPKAAMTQDSRASLTKRSSHVPTRFEHTNRFSALRIDNSDSEDSAESD